MDKEICWDALACRDHQIALATINWLNNCQTRDEFNQALKVALLPLLACNGVFYGRLAGERNTLQLLDSINQSTCCQEGWKRFLHVVLQNLPGEGFICDNVNMSLPVHSANLVECLDGLSSCHHSCDQSWQQSHNNYTLITVFDEGHQSAFRFYFCRLTNHHQIFSQREIELLKILRPALLQTLNFILFREETLNRRKVQSFWSDHADPVVAIRNDGAVLLQSQAFVKAIGPELNLFLSTALNLIQFVQCNQIGYYSFLSKLGKRLYEIKLTLIHSNADYQQDVYFLHLSRVTNKNGKIFNRLDRTGLTSRELEIATLIYQGNSPKDIAEEISLSYHTVRNHIKSIYSKLGVSTRSEMLVKLA
ncbi:response regulator transcription factor [Nitrosomonas ureae]|uniref:Regulatory protein, luxR family n=1 Tax=Nitrosomonas ureae TaxID=44577 RepID=A0A1H2GCZ9_9PROT|nr:helix-turn-helix transcriptional regulator [Nitrosomonas ureae]ALQ51719.1 hypothetical protein ATY38_11090 [Nitrosomonas ureae]SDU17533.1 regulatory protein, luxR family [Nitrosomonas ureae]